MCSWSGVRRYRTWMGASTDATGVVDERATSLRAWVDLIWDRFAPHEIAPRDGDEMRGSVRTRRLGHLQASTVVSAPQTFIRTKSLVSRESSPLFVLGLVEKGVGYLNQDGRECTVANGDFTLYDTSRPYTWRFDGDFRFRVYTWPLASVPLGGAESQRVTAITVPRAQGIGRLVAPIFVQVTCEESDLSATGSTRMADELAGLAITSALEAAEEEPTVNDDTLRTIQVYVEERLSDPGLNAEQIASAFFMSTRTLHRLFARRGLTVSGWIKTRRLERCRHALRAAPRSEQPIREIAARHGLLNPSYFSREFAQQYGESPREFRRRMPD